MTQIIKDSEINSIKGEKIVLTGGCFDILHPGHLEFLKKAKDLGNTLVVLLESDENIRKLKGEKRPYNTQTVRAQNLTKLNIIDYVVLLVIPQNSKYYYNLVKLLHPAIIAVTEGDPLLKEKKEQAELVDGKVVTVMERDERHSTSRIVRHTKK